MLGNHVQESEQDKREGRATIMSESLLTTVLLAQQCWVLAAINVATSSLVLNLYIAL